MWRNAGVTYIRYSQIAANVTRKCTKSTAKEGAPAKIVHPKLKVTKWENGKPIRPE
jgi:hypothetical protein